MHPRLSLVALLALLACGQEPSSPQQGDLLFSDGSPEELTLAQEMALAHLYSPGGLALEKGVEDVRVRRSHVDPLSMAHVRVQQTLGGVPVWGAEAIVHFQQDGQLFSVTDSLLAGVKVDTQPEYSEDEAVDVAAEASVGWEKLTDDPQADLWVFRAEDGQDHLAWRVQMRRIDGTEHTSMPVVFVDAHTAEVLWQYNNLQTATCSGATNAYGTQSFDCYTDGTSFYTEDTTRGSAAYSYGNTTASLYYVSSTSTSFGSDMLTRNAVEAHWVGEKTLTYYSSVHGRNGIDGVGGPDGITSHGMGFISSLTSYSTNYVNAFWDGTYMVYGDGDGFNSSSLTVLDVGGHEFTHGVTENEANLVYSGEPGHLNESYSDVFGAMVERAVLGESANTWLIGEAAWTPGTSGDALRYMNDPADDGYSYDYYTSGIGSVDVHYGSGVPNLAFYLLSEGGTHPRGKSTVNVTAIGADDAADIWYLAMTSYLTSSSNFSSARTAQINAATALFGAGSQQVQSVTNSWAAVGVGAAYGVVCTTTNYSGSLSRVGRSAYAPSSSGLATGSNPMTLTLTAPSGADFDLYLEKKSGRNWVSVATGATRSTSGETFSYTGTSGTYRARVYSYSGTGTFALGWCN